MADYNLSDDQHEAIVRLGFTLRSKALHLGILRPNPDLAIALADIQTLAVAMLAILEQAQGTDSMVK